MKAIITGASGMIGGLILNHCLDSPQIKNLVSIGRRKSLPINSKLLEVVPSSFTDYADVSEHFIDASIVFYCLGAYTGSVADDHFKEITVDYTKAFANALYKHSPNAIFCFLSGSGADPNEKSRISFSRYKGMAENYLVSKNFSGLNIFRPAYIYPVEKRTEPNIAYRIYRKLYPLLKYMGPGTSIKSTELAKAMFKAGISNSNLGILENRDILNFLNS